jgi:glycosyltransferase involved in cell wall biosynthesis
MHITFYKPGNKRTPPKLYGGRERAAYWLGKALMELGHQVTLIANAKSHIPGAELRAIPGKEKDPRAWLRLVPDSTDIIQIFGVPNPVAHKPFLTRMGGNGGPGQRYHQNTIFVSRNHAANHGSRHFIYNGVDPGEYAFSEKREDYAVFLAKARSSVKNLPGAVQVARRAGLELRVLGSRNWPLNLQQLLPPIRGVRYYGMVGGQQKRDLLARARCLIFPVRWDEPGANALNEALVSGCYVVGTPYGCLSEIVTPDVGVLSIKADELAEAVKNPQRFNPRMCRERVLHGGLTHLDMARKYLDCYERILTHGSLGEPDEPAPVTRPDFMAKQLLPWED